MKLVVISGMALVIVLSVAAYLFLPDFLKTDTIQPKMAATDIKEAAYIPPPLKDTYRNDTYRFSLSVPEGFSPSEFANENEGGHTVLIQNSKGEGIQIFITPFPDDTKILTADDVRASIPDMMVTNEQPVEVGPEYRGVAFKSDNEAFGGASREVWFVFRGNLYQISTYARLDTLLQSIFATWQFF